MQGVWFIRRTCLCEARTWVVLSCDIAMVSRRKLKGEKDPWKLKARSKIDHPIQPTVPSCECLLFCELIIIERGWLGAIFCEKTCRMSLAIMNPFFISRLLYIATHCATAWSLYILRSLIEKSSNLFDRRDSPNNE